MRRWISIFTDFTAMTFFPKLIPNRKRGEGSSIICHVPKSFPTPPGTPPGHLFFFQNSNSAAVFLIARHKNGSAGTFAQICKLEPEKQMPPRFVGGSSWNCCKTSLDSRFDRFQFLRNPLFQLSWDCWHLRNSLCTSVALAGWKIIQLPENAANLGLIC